MNLHEMIILTFVDDPCLSFTCQNGGTCQISQGGSAQCSCPPNYSGQNCETAGKDLK